MATPFNPLITEETKQQLTIENLIKRLNLVEQKLDSMHQTSKQPDNLVYQVKKLVQLCRSATDTIDSYKEFWDLIAGIERLLGGTNAK